MNFYKKFRNSIQPSKNKILSASVVTICYILYSVIRSVPVTNDAFIQYPIQTLASPVSGIINHLYPKVNQHIENGNPIFSIDDTIYVDTVNGIASQIEQKKESLLQSELNIRRSELNLEQDIRTFRYNEKLYREKLKLSKHKYVSALDLKNIKTTASNLRSEIEKDKVSITLLHSQHRTYQEVIKQLQSQLNTAKFNLNNTTVYASSGGYISNPLYQVGAPVTANSPILSFINTDKVYVQINMSESDLKHVKVGMKTFVSLRVDHYSEKYLGKVLQINSGISRVNRSTTSLQVVSSINNQFFSPARVPVIIELDKSQLAKEDMSYFKQGYSALVGIDTGAMSNQVFHFMRWLLRVLPK
ncbi:HlyD family efflux transporter periplasmic adaptor subunit [Vibrio profundum]|uniref:HlyD family secretion protein n=1 Tax=Vibrio profundum TaxID=2910247 RepID=UPI003D108CAA